MSRILIRQGEGPEHAYQRITDELEQQRQALNRILNEPIEQNTDGKKFYSTHGDERRLRGIPAIGRGVTGAIPGTRPEDSVR